MPPFTGDLRRPPLLDQLPSMLDSADSSKDPSLFLDEAGLALPFPGLTLLYARSSSIVEILISEFVRVRSRLSTERLSPVNEAASQEVDIARTCCPLTIEQHRVVGTAASVAVCTVRLVREGGREVVIVVVIHVACAAAHVLQLPG